MDVQTGLICVGLIVVSAAAILLISMFGIKEKTYEEAIAEQRKLPDDLLLGKREKGKEKKHKNKTGKKVKEKKDDKEKDDKEDEKNDHVQFEDTPQILAEPVVQEEKNVKGGGGSKKKGKIDKVKPILVNKDEPVVLAPDFVPSQTEETNNFNITHPKDDLELIRSHSTENLQQSTQSEPVVNKSPRDTPTKSKKNVQSKKIEDEKIFREVKAEQQKETPVKEPKDISLPKNKKKKNDILAQIGGDKDGVTFSLLTPLVQKAELSRSEIQILIDQLLNKQLDNPLEHSEWSEGRADPVIKLKKQLAEKEKALADEQEASVAVQNKLKELRSELNTEKSRLSASVRQLEEALSAKVTETQTLHTRMQHILETHAAEKQGFTRQIEQLQAKLNDNVTIIQKMQEDQGQTQGHLQQELIAQRKQLEVQFAQMRDNENALKSQLAQKHAEMQELQNLNISVTQELQILQSTYEATATEGDMLRQQLNVMGDQLIQSEGQLQIYKDAGERIQDMARQIEDSHRTIAELEHRLQNTIRHEQDLQKQSNSLQSELNVAKTEASEASELKAELNKLKSDLSVSQNEAADVSTLKNELQQSQSALLNLQNELKTSQNEIKSVKADLNSAQEELKDSHRTISELKSLSVEVERLKQSERNSSDSQIEVSRLQEENNRLSSQNVIVVELQKEIRQLREENETLASQLAAKTERPAAEGRENGVETKTVKNNVQLIENSNLLAQKETLLDELRSEVTNKDTELTKLTVQIENLQTDINNERSQISTLRDELELQKTKNNELRTKNWKVMEALSAAESRANSNTGKVIDELSQKVKIESEKSTEALLQRIFPDVVISESSHEKWLNAFVIKISAIIEELKSNRDGSGNVDELEKQNKILQGMVSHYKKIIDDAEGMLNGLQSHIESQEERWEAQLKQKEETLTGLRIEIDDLRSRAGESEKLKEKIKDLETRLEEAEAFRQQTHAELNALKTKPSATKADKHLSFAAVEQLGEDKERLLQALHHENSNKIAVDAEVARLRTLLEISESSLAKEKNLVSQLNQEVSQLKTEVNVGSSEQSTVNGQPISESSKPESSSVAQSLLAALEKSLKNTELASEKCELGTSKNYNNSTDDKPVSGYLLSKNFTSSASSQQTFNTIDDDTHLNATGNTLNGQQHKKHKKKRKGGSGKK